MRRFFSYIQSGFIYLFKGVTSEPSCIISPWQTASLSPSGRRHSSRTLVDQSKPLCLLRLQIFGPRETTPNCPTNHRLRSVADGLKSLTIWRPKRSYEWFILFGIQCLNASNPSVTRTAWQSKANKYFALQRMCSSLRCSGSQSVSHTINALISGTRHHKVSIHYAWVASARSPSWTFSADWRSRVDSQVLFKAHLYVRALLRLRRCYIPTLEGLKWAPLSLHGARREKKKKKVIEVQHQTLGQPHSAASRTAVWWTATLADLSLSLSDASKVWTREEKCWRAPRLLRQTFFTRHRMISDTQVMLMKLLPNPPKSLWNTNEDRRRTLTACACEEISSSTNFFKS